MRLIGFVLVTVVLAVLVFLTGNSTSPQPLGQPQTSADADFKSLKIQ